MKRKLFLLFVLLSSLSFVMAQKSKHRFELGDSSFLLDGKPLQMISGEIHYTRVPREAWRARFKMAKAMGLNTIGTYVFWNVHEPQKGIYDFKDNNDIEEFVKIAQEEGLWVVLRPSPYVCAEWEFGGYPYWLQEEKDLVVRSKNPKYLALYKDYIQEIGKRLAKYQVNHGGNILMVQIENEYGSFGSDKEYLDINRKMFIDAGFDGLLFTCDPANDLVAGHLPGLLPAVNGLDKPTAIKKLINENHNGKGPYYIAEWYPAWFDWWGTAHHTVPYGKYVTALDSVLGAGISINMYMFHGGTTRGFMNGANYNDHSPYEPQTSSYDYDAPLDEAGNATEKFMAFRKVIEKHLPKGKVLPEVPKAKPVVLVGSISLDRNGSVQSLLSNPVHARHPLTFEDLRQDYGFVVYRTHGASLPSGFLKINGLRDYAIVYVNGKRIGTLDRRLNQDSLAVDASKDTTIDIVVENLGRINFGKYLLDNKKGITQNVTINGVELVDWDMYGLPFASEPKVAAHTNTAVDFPTIKTGTFQLAKLGDMYLDMSQWGKGAVWINGHNLGRYWRIGPQQTLYVPIEWLKKGENKITILELLKTDRHTVETVTHPILDQLQK